MGERKRIVSECLISGTNTTEKKKEGFGSGNERRVREASSEPDVELGGVCREEDLELRRDI